MKCKAKWVHFVANILTRIHSSRMPTGHSLTVCQSLLPGGVSALGGVLPGGVVSALGGVLPGMSALVQGYTRRQTHTTSYK